MVYSQKQGLSSPNIHKIIQDKYGFIWVATQDGLNRFDGREFIKYNLGLPAKKQLFSSDVRDIVLQENGDLIWAINNNGGVNGIELLTGNIVYTIPYNYEGGQTKWRICAVAVHNKIFIASSHGLELFDCGERVFVKPAALPHLGFLASADIRWIDYDPSGNLIIAVLNQGVFVVNPSTLLVKRKYLHDTNGQDTDEFWPLCGAGFDNNYYLGTKKGVYKLNLENDRGEDTVSRMLNQATELAISNEVNCLTVIDKDKLLIGSNQLKVFNTTEKQLETISPSFSDALSMLNNTTATFIDKQGNLWIGSKEGLCVLKKSKPVFKAYKNDEALFKKKLGHVYAICKYKKSVFLVGTIDGLFEIDQHNQLKQILNKGLVQNICRLDSNIVFFSGNAGIKIYDNSNVYEINQKFPELMPYRKWQINSIVNLNDTITIIGTESNSGVLIWNRKSRTVTNYSENQPGKFNLSSKIVNSIFLTKSRQVIVLSDYLLSIFDPQNEQFTSFTLTDKKGTQPLGVFMQMAETSNNYWLTAYGYGLIKLDKQFNFIKKFSFGEKFTNTGLYAIFNYKDSLLIITSNYGISAFDIKTERVENYSEEDGINNNTFEEASSDTGTNMFYAGGVNGFTEILPGNMVLNNTAPYFFFTKIEAENNKGIFLDTFNLNPLRYSFSSTTLQAKIYFTGIEYNNPARVTYKYRILENSKEWIDNGNENFVPFIATGPGTYHLQVKAANEDGIWSEPRELILEFLPKWYQTWWFYFLIAFTIAAVLYSLYRYRISQIKKQHTIRKNIATDLHDDLGSTLNSVKVFTNLAISGVKQQESLQQIKNNLNEATMGLRDMIWVLDDSLDTVDELVNRLRQFVLPVAEASNIAVQITADNDVNSRQLTKEEKRNLFLVCKEVINNSIKYSGAATITLFIKTAGKKIEIVIADNGKGFDEATVKKGYGLKNMHYRAGQVKYKVQLLSSPGTGTTVRIFPAG